MKRYMLVMVTAGSLVAAAMGCATAPPSRPDGDSPPWSFNCEDNYLKVKGLTGLCGAGSGVGQEEMARDVATASARADLASKLKTRARSEIQKYAATVQDGKKLLSDETAQKVVIDQVTSLTLQNTVQKERFRRNDDPATPYWSLVVMAQDSVDAFTSAVRSRSDQAIQELNQKAQGL